MKIDSIEHKALCTIAHTLTGMWKSKLTQTEIEICDILVKIGYLEWYTYEGDYEPVLKQGLVYNSL